MATSKKPNLLANPIKKLFNKITISELTKWYWHNEKTILWNLTGRIILSSLFVFSLLLLISIFGNFFLTEKLNLESQLFNFGLVLALSFFPALYCYRTINQYAYAHELNLSLTSLRRYLTSFEVQLNKIDYRRFQNRINGLRTSLRDYINYSQILSQPVHNYEIFRLLKKIDIFFNTTSEALLPLKQEFCEEQEITLQKQIKNPDFDKYLVHINNEKIEKETGIINEFSPTSMDDFSRHLGKVIFDAESRPYNPFSFKIPVNLLYLSSFFEKWNSIIKACPNCHPAFDKAQEDITKYYKLITRTESKKSERMWNMRDNVTVVFISVIISTMIQYFLK